MNGAAELKLFMQHYLQFVVKGDEMGLMGKGVELTTCPGSWGGGGGERPYLDMGTCIGVFCSSSTHLMMLALIINTTSNVR